MTDLTTDLTDIGLGEGQLTDIPIPALPRRWRWAGRGVGSARSLRATPAARVRCRSTRTPPSRAPGRPASRETIMQEQARLASLYGYRQNVTYGYSMWRR